MIGRSRARARRANAIAAGSATPPVPAWLDTLIASSAPGALITAYGAYTTGMRFTATATSCTGVRFWWGTGSGPASVTATLWDASTGTAIKSETIAAVAGGSFAQTTAAFGSNALVAGQTYVVSTYWAGGYNTTNALALSLPQVFAAYTVTAGWVGNGGGFGYPGGAQSFGAYVEPLF